MKKTKFISLNDVISIINRFSDTDNEVRALARPGDFDITSEEVKGVSKLEDLFLKTGMDEIMTGTKTMIDLTDSRLLEGLKDVLEKCFVNPSDVILLLVNGGALELTINELRLFPFVQRISQDMFWFPSDFKSWASFAISETFNSQEIYGSDINFEEFSSAIYLAKELGII